MAIAFDKSGKASGALLTASVSLAAAAADELAIIFVAWNKTYDFASLTVGGSASGITQIGSEFTFGDSDKMRAYYLLNPPTSSSAYLLTTTAPGDGAHIYVILYSGTDLTSPIDSSNTGSATQNVTLTTTVVASDCWLAGWVTNFGAGGITPTGGTGTTIRDSDTGRADGDSNATVGTGSQSLVFNTTSGATTIGGYVVSFKPPAAAGGGAHFLPLLGVGT